MGGELWKKERFAGCDWLRGGWDVEWWKVGVQVGGRVEGRA